MTWPDDATETWPKWVAAVHRQRWPNVPPEAIMVKLAEEVGEVAAEIYDGWEDGSADRRERVGEEIGDVLCVLIALADRFGFEWADIERSACQRFVGRWGS